MKELVAVRFDIFSVGHKFSIDDAEMPVHNTR